MDEKDIARRVLEAAKKKRLSRLSSVVSLSHDLTRIAAPQGWRFAPPPSAALALTRPDPCQPRLWSVRRHPSCALPWGLGPDDGIEDAEQASHACDERDFLGAPPFHQSFVVLANDRVPTGRRQSCHV